MAAIRGVLHLNKIDAFASYAAKEGYQREATKGHYEVLRLRLPGRSPLIFHRRDSGDHATVALEGPAGSLVRRFLRKGR